MAGCDNLTGNGAPGATLIAQRCRSGGHHDGPGPTAGVVPVFGAAPRTCRRAQLRALLLTRHPAPGPRRGPAVCGHGSPPPS